MDIKKYFYMFLYFDSIRLRIAKASQGAVALDFNVAIINLTLENNSICFFLLICVIKSCDK